MNNDQLKPFVQAVDYNQQALEEFQFAVEMSQGQFSLVLVKCNYAVLRNCIRTRLLELCPNIRELDLEPSVTKLYSKIQEIQGNQQLNGLVIYGLESVQNIEQLLLSLNPVREEFRKNCHFAIFLWINDDIVRLFKRLIPDFESWTTRIIFIIPPDILVDQLKHNCHVLFSRILELGANSQFIPNYHFFSSFQRLEIAAARRDLENQGHELDLVLRASIEFIQGRELNRKDEINTALAYYQYSLELWQDLAQELKNIEQQKLDYSSVFSELEAQVEELQYLPLKQAVVLFYIGLCHSRKAELFYNETTDHWQLAKQYFQQCLDIFVKKQRLDLVAKFIFPYQKILKELESWDELNQITKKVQKLHQIYKMQVELAQDYAFFAEVALSKNDAVQGKSLIEQALSILDNQGTEQDRGWYWFLLGKAQRQLKDIDNAVASLKNAKKSDPYKNPQLYFDVVQELHDIYYFAKHEYLQAFELKEEQRCLKTQLGITAFVAFVGTERLEASIRVTKVKYQQRKSDKKEQISQEIFTSGRQYDIEQLVSRIGSTQHKLTIIHGQSGVGKSFLVNAGLVPILQSQSIGTLDVLTVVLRTYTDWVRELGNRCQQALEEKEITGYLVLNSTQTIINQLEQNAHYNLLTVIIFDQFEEFFFVSDDPIKRKEFFDFLSQIFNIKNSVVKIILSLREDYLHYLLICNRLENMTAINHDILNKNILYHLGNFSPENAKEIIKKSTQGSQFQLEPQLIDYMVEELSENLGEVRPIEMQIMGAQMQFEGITTLAKYREFCTKEKLIQNYLENVIQVCGQEHQQIAELVLYLLTHEKGTRPIRTRIEIENDLKDLIINAKIEKESLDIVFNIFVASGLVLLLPDYLVNHYQLVHQYLSDFIRKQHQKQLKILNQGVEIWNQWRKNNSSLSIILTQVKLYRVNLSGANLSGANLNGANLSGANLSGANLSGANLLAIQALETNFQGAILTAACIQDWNINSETKLNEVICEYIYLKLENIESKITFTERRPSDPNKIFAPGDFARLVQSLLETVDLIFSKGIDWSAFFTSFQGLQIENSEGNLSIQAIEKKHDGSFVVRVDVPINVDKGEIESKFYQKYEQELKRLETIYYEKLQAKDREIEIYKEQSANMNDIVKILANRSINVVNEAKAMTQGNTYQQSGQFGIGHMSDGTIEKGANVAGVIHEAQQKSIAEVAKEIQDLFKQLEKTYPTTTIAEKMVVGTEIIKQIENDPTWKQRVINAGKEGGLGFLEKSFDNPIGALLIGAIKGWVETN